MRLFNNVIIIQVIYIMEGVKNGSVFVQTGYRRSVVLPFNYDSIRCRSDIPTALILLSKNDPPVEDRRRSAAPATLLDLAPQILG